MLPYKPATLTNAPESQESPILSTSVIVYWSFGLVARQYSSVRLSVLPKGELLCSTVPPLLMS